MNTETGTDGDSTDEATTEVDEEFEKGFLATAWATVFRSAGARVAVLPLSAILGIVNTRLIIENFGKDAYAQYGLIVAVGALLPFADLGMSAAIMNAVGGSDDPANEAHVRRVLLTSIRVLLCSAGVILLVDFVISAAGLWPTLMGEGLLPGSGSLAIAASLAIIALTLPVAFGQRVMTGLGKNHLSILLLGLQTPLVLGVLLLIIRFGGGGSGGYLPIVPYSVTFVLAVATTLIAARMMRPAVWAAVRSVAKVRSERGEKVFDVAWPMLIQMIALPVAMQTDRLVLSHVSSTDELAEYNLAAQMYLPIWQVVTASGIALWPLFARSRARGGPGRSPAPLSAGFALAALGATAFITLISGWLADVASGGEVQVPLSLAFAFSVFMICQATKYPLGMFMTDPRGLRYQAVMVVLMVPVNLGLSIVLAQRYGAIGPVIGSFVGVLLFQVVANSLYVRHALRRPYP